jgi:cytochrome c oxidase cbb3-type subunit 2
MMNDKQVKWVIIGMAFIWSAFALSTKAHAREENLKLGKDLYQKECAICHNEDGMGNGPAARFLDPKPRDFTKGIFKIRSTPFLLTDEDLFNTITQGIPGTLMPAFEYLKEDERWDLVAYVKSFSEAFETEIPEPVPIPIAPPQTEQHLVDGEILYQEAGCVECHGKYGKGDGPSANTLKDVWGNPIRAYDFTVSGMMKGGSTVEDVYRALYVGIGGTPMPAYVDALTEEQTWALAYYILSLSEEVPPALPPGNSISGRDLLMGVTRFKNGGPPCMGCHSVMGIRAFGGGPWGPDLTIAHQKFKEDGLATFLETIPFPTMEPLYHPRPLSEEERGHLLAFLRGMQPTGVQAVTVRVSPLYTPTILMGVLGVISLTLTGLIAGKKKVEVR